MKAVVRAIALSLAGLVVFLVIAEASLHLFPGLLPIEIRTVGENSGVAHPVIGNILEPGSSGVIRSLDFSVPYRVDDHGFRNSEAWPARADVVVIGDSHVFGYGVPAESAWPQLLAGLSGRNVINMGLLGASPQQYLRIYETYARALRPKVVIVGFFAANDFFDALQFEQWLASGSKGNYRAWRDFGHVTVADIDHLPGRIALGFRQHVYLPRLFKYGIRGILAGERHGTVLYQLPDGTEMRLDPHNLAEKTIEASAGQRGFSVALEALLRMQKLATDDGSRFLVVFQPSKEVIYLPIARQQALPNPSADIRSALTVRGIPFLNLAPAFRERAMSGELLYFPTDGHPNADGYRLIAEQVANWLASDARQGGSDQ